MAFTPNGTIKLLANVPLDNSYNHTVKYPSRSAQTTAFMAKAVKTYEHCIYIREHKRIRVPDCSDDVIMCNYLMYQNLNYGRDKWFYGFITGVFYVNDHCAEIEFEIDVMQTWMYDFAFKPCFIERNHTATDRIGEYILPEPLETGEMIINEQGTIPANFENWDIVAFTTFDWNTWTYSPYGNLTDGNLYSGLIRTVIGEIQIHVSGASAYATYVTDPSNKLADLVNNHANLVDGLVALVMSPHVGGEFTVSFNKPTSATQLAGYTPKNQKLYTFQFYRMFVTDGNGSGKWYAFEDFKRIGSPDSIRFLTKGDFTADQTIICAPRAYRGVNNTEYNFEEAVSMAGIPQCAWLSDAYKTYLAMSQGNLSLSLATSATSVVGGAAMMATGGGAAVGAGMAASGIMGAISTISNLYDKAKEPPKVHGSLSATALYTVGRKAFIPYAYTCKPEYLKVADDFLSQYGYSICETGVPNIDSRPYWNYIKTQGCLIVPDGVNGLPTTDVALIESIHDRGITYWKTFDNVGNYTLNNAPSA